MRNRLDDLLITIILAATPLVILLYLVKFPIQTLAAVALTTLLCLVGEAFR